MVCCLWGDYMDRQPTWWIGLCTASHIFRPTNAMKKVVSILAESVLLFPNLRWETCSDCKLWAPLLQQSELTFLGSRILRPPILLSPWVELCVREKSEPPNTFSNICFQNLPWGLNGEVFKTTLNPPNTFLENLSSKSSLGSHSKQTRFAQILNNQLMMLRQPVSWASGNNSKDTSIFDSLVCLMW